MDHFDETDSFSVKYDIQDLRKIVMHFNNGRLCLIIFFFSIYLFYTCIFPKF